MLVQAISYFCLYQRYIFITVLFFVCWSIPFIKSSYQLWIFTMSFKVCLISSICSLLFCIIYAGPYAFISRLISCVYSFTQCSALSMLVHAPALFVWSAVYIHHYSDLCLLAHALPKYVLLVVYIHHCSVIYMLFHNLSMYIISYVHINHCSIPGFIPLYTGPRAFIVHFISCIYSRLFFSPLFLVHTFS